jgi:hypothetical protein
MVGDVCQYEADNRELDDGEPEKVVLVDAAYLDRHALVVRERIAMAGGQAGRVAQSGAG